MVCGMSETELNELGKENLGRLQRLIRKLFKS